METLSKTPELYRHIPQVDSCNAVDLFKHPSRTGVRGPSQMAEFRWPVNLAMPFAWEEKWLGLNYKPVLELCLVLLPND